MARLDITGKCYLGQIIYNKYLSIMDQHSITRTVMIKTLVYNTEVPVLASDWSIQLSSRHLFILLSNFVIFVV